MLTSRVALLLNSHEGDAGDIPNSRKRRSIQLHDQLVCRYPGITWSGLISGSVTYVGGPLVGSCISAMIATFYLAVLCMTVPAY